MSNANSLIILDFETTGLSPAQGDRAIEIGAVKLVDGIVTEEFQQLMNPGRRVSSFIENYTGITNRMLATAPPCDEVMAKFADFIGSDNLVAHNASFDQRFLDAEFQRIGHQYKGDFSCSVLLARRVFQSAPSYSLGNLVSHLGIESTGGFHRALYDAQMTAKLWMALYEEIQRQVKNPTLTFALIQKMVKTPKKSIAKLLAQY